MIVSLSWLKNYVDIDVDTATLAHDLTMLGLNVEHVTSTGLAEPLVVIGHVLERNQHPDADRLSVCSVDVGGEAPLEIVCGAPNVAAGQTVPVALVGAKLPNGLKIRKSKIRGVKSNGMICSEIELGLGDDAAGIMVLDTDAAPGTSFADVLGEADTILEIEVTPNRPDQLSHIGVSREVAALYETALRLPLRPEPREGRDACFSVEIEDPADCYRFTGRVVRGVKVGPSPAWLRQALESVGLNSINNIVDISNYVMMETGQPLHAYDLDRLPGRRMGVRRGRKGEKLLALDEVEYDVGPEHLLITDGDEPVGIAGVIGGAPTAVHDDTTDLLIESAAFNARSVRATRRSLNVNTDASYRFERGSDREACADASDRAARLVLELAGGELGEFVDAYPTPFEARTVSIRRSNTRRLLGISLSLDDIAGLLERLSFQVVGRDDDSVSVRVPSWRDDIVEETDLVEEVARLNGYDKIGQGWPFRTTTHGMPDPFERLLDDCATHLVARGHTELVGSAFVDTGRLAALGYAAGDPRGNPVKILNPLTTLHGSLRTTLLPGVLDAIRRNVDYGTREIQVFETGTVFLAGRNGALPDEPVHLLIAQSRPGGSLFWNNSKKATQLYDIKREIEILADAVRFPLAGLDYRFERENGRFRYEQRGRRLIEGGIISARMAEVWDIAQPVWYAEMDLTALAAMREARQSFKPLPEYPASRRDLSLVIPAGVGYGDLEKALARSGGRLLESSQVFDVYQGGSLPDGHTAIGVRLTFRSHEGTLTDADVDAVVAKIVRRLESEFSVRLRS